MKKGKLMVFHGAGQPLEMQSRNLRKIQKGEILVRNIYTTICGSDLHTYSGIRKETCPTVLGHEIIGEIEMIESSHCHHDYQGRQLKIGDIITWTIFASDPLSSNALDGMPQKGDNLFKYGHGLVDGNDDFHGGLGEYCYIKRGSCILKIPAALPLPIAATINCAIATVAGAIRLAGNLKNKNIVIFGMGTLGVTCAAMCKDAGAAWVGAADIENKRLQDALSFGADIAVNIKEEQKIPGKINSNFFTRRIDVVFDMSGSADAMENGISMLAVGGVAVWVGAVFSSRKLQIDAEIIIRNLLTIRGLHNYNYEDFNYALDFLNRNWQRYPFDRVVEKEFTLDTATEAFDYALTNKPLRVGIKI